MVVISESDNDVELWHRGLGHMSNKEMKALLLEGKLP